MKGLVVPEESGVVSAAVRPGALVALLPVANRPLALHALDTLHDSGADDVAFVVRPARLAELTRALARPGQDATLFKQILRRRLPPVAGWTRSASGADQSDYELIGVHVFGNESIEFLDTILAHDIDSHADVVHGQWVACAGAVDDVLAANRAALDELTQDHDLSGCSDCRIEGRVRVHPTAHVSRSLLRGPIVIGAGALVESACLGPYTAVADGAIVENSDVLESVLCEGAIVRDVSSRIESSVLGPGATVCGDFRLPKSLRLGLGAHATVTVA
jgi:NDP-sugar pyrophosphorylase family protein